MFILTADPDFIDLAGEELVRTEPAAQPISELAPGVMLVNSDGRFFNLAQLWQKQPPIFIRHIFPVQAQATIKGSRADLTVINRVITREFLDLIDPSLPFSVQSRILADVSYKPFDINSAASDIIHTRIGAPLNVRKPVQILSIVIAAETAYLGLSLAAHNLSDWGGGIHRFAHERDQISRAEFKLLEALAAFQIDLPPRGIALDLGAAPGGWTRVLRQRKQYVTAVDPAQLHPSLQTDKNVRHKQMSAEAYLAEYPDQYDLIVNDMRLDARDSARLMASYAPYLYPHGLIIMTLKLPKENREAVIEHALTILRQAYQINNARQLFHNRSEITIHLTKPEIFG